MPSSPKRARRANLVIGAVLVGLLLLIAVVNLVYTPYGPLDVNIHARYAPPSLHHCFGTDDFSRDILSRIKSGAGVSNTVTICSVLLALGIMTVVGPSKWGVVIALGLAYTPSVSRIARGAALSLRQRDYVVASQTMRSEERRV